MKKIAVLASVAAVLLSLSLARADELTVLSAATMRFALKDVGGLWLQTRLPITGGPERRIRRAAGGP